MTFNNTSSLDTVIKVIGVGNGGCNAVNRMIEEGLENVEFIAMNTDAQALSRSNAPITMVLGDRVTQGLGAGTDPEKGAEAAREDIARIEEVVNGANLVFIASSFGGGTGTGASPVVAEAAKKAGALTIGVVTKPFDYEGKLKMNRAEAGIDKMLSVVDSLIIIPNENLYDMVDMDNYSYEEALSVVDDILRQGVQGISDIITQTGFINVDFADVKTMISLSNGRAHLGIGVGKGDDRLNKAITNAFENPLLDVSSIKNARGILANIVCPKDFAMKEYRAASKIINNYANENANIKIGVCPKEDLKDEIIVTIVATGFDANAKNDTEEKDNDSNVNDLINKNISNTSINRNISNDKASSVNNTITNNLAAEQKIEHSLENISEVDDINNTKNEASKEPEMEIELGKKSSEVISNSSIEVKEEISLTKKEIPAEIKSEEKILKQEEAQKTEEVKKPVLELKEEKIVQQEEVKEIKENRTETIVNRIPEEDYEVLEEKSSFESKLNAIRKPIITKNRFNSNNIRRVEEDTKEDIRANYVEEDDEIFEEERFNKNIVNNKKYEVQKSTINNAAVKKMAEQMRFDDEEKHNNPNLPYSNEPNKKPFDIVSDEYMDKHNQMGFKMAIFGENVNQETDLEKPAFLRRQIQARNTLR